MARQYYSEVDNSKSVASAGAMQAGIVVIAKRGRVNEAVPVETVSTLIDKYGYPDPKGSTTMYSALAYLHKSSTLNVVRAIHTAPEGSVESSVNFTARFSAALLKAKVADLAERVVEPYVKGAWGLTQADIDSFQFPVYARQREYKNTNIVAKGSVDNSVIVNSLEIEVGSKISFGESVDDTSPVFSVTSKEVRENSAITNTIKTSLPQNVTKGLTIRRVFKSLETTNLSVVSRFLAGTQELELSATTGLESGVTIMFDSNQTYIIQSVDSEANKITLRSPLVAEVANNTSVILEKRTYKSLGVDYFATKDQQGSDEIFMSCVDMLGEGDLCTFISGISNVDNEFIITGKNTISEEQKFLVLDKIVDINNDSKVWLMSASEFEQRDVGLFYSDNQGTWGNNISVLVSESSDYPDTARIFSVYYKGEFTGERFEVTFENFVDGLGKQLYCEDVINGKSEYIRFKHNKDMVDSEGKAILPMLNNYSVWLESPKDVFKSSTYKTTETLTRGETDVRVSDYTNLEIGTRVKFGAYPQEYKVSGKSSIEIDELTTEYHITIDRGIQEAIIPVDSDILVFDKVENQIPKKIDVTYHERANVDFDISGIKGKLLDAGGNYFTGGHNGSTPDVGDMIQALQKVFSRRVDIDVSMLLSGGVFDPAYAQALVTICENRGDCFAFLSTDPSALDMTDKVKGCTDFRASINVNSMRASLFADWAWAYDPYNKKDVLIPLDGVAAALQSVEAEGGIWGVPVAGWSKGNTFFIKRLAYNWSEDEREKLLAKLINPCKADKTRGISIWGNKTLYGARSFMQSRNVAFIFIQMRREVREYMEDQHWQVQDANSRAIMCQSLLSSFQRYMPVLNKLSVIDTTTTDDEDNNRIRIYVSFTPKGIAEDIYITLAVDKNASTVN